ncbi:MAG: SDR family oxidoreductase [Cypionkella sp.]|nr:SDR family oxidoreductase [Cypionkella sp.]
MQDMSGKTVLITGASQGIGAAAAAAFVAAGARVMLAARNADKLTALAQTLGPNARAIPCDVGDFAAVQAAVDAAQDWGGRLDVLINNAGVITPIAHLAEADPAQWASAIDTNLRGVFHGIRAALPVMRARGAGTIITVSSGAAVNPMEGWGAYCASKAGALMLTRVAHLEESAHGLRILGLSPGTVATEMQVKIKASGINPVSQLGPSAHIPPDWAAHALVWMCGPQADPWLGRDVSLRDSEVRAMVGVGL